MSLIEQAAKRLEELRRAGALTDEDSSAAADDSPQRTASASPRRKRSSARSTRAPHEPARPPLPAVEEQKAPSAEASSAPAARAARPPVEIDLERLKALGFVTPDAPKSQIADEFRVIKRPILRNARGTSGAREPERHAGHGHERACPARARRSPRSIWR